MSKGKIGDRVNVTDGSLDGHTGVILSVDDHGGIRIKRDADGVEVRVSSYSVHKPPDPEKGELVMHVEIVYQIPNKVVALQGIIECDRIKTGDRVVIEYEGQNIPAKIFAIETFNKTHDEATQGQGMVLVFYPTPELRGIKKSCTDVVKDGKYVFEKSTAVVRRDKNETSVVHPGA